MYDMIQYIISFAAASALCMHISALLSNIHHNWESLQLSTSTWETISHRVKIKDSEKQHQNQRPVTCADNKHKQQVDLVGVWVKESRRWLATGKFAMKWKKKNQNEPQKTPKQSKWAKQILPCSAQDMLIMVTASTGNTCRETNFSITASSNCAGFCKIYLYIFLAFGKKESIMKALPAQENIIWQSFGY